MKLALITDTHWGIRNDNPHFYDAYRDFFEDVFFPTCQKEGIRDIIHLGDVFDKRKTLNYVTYDRFLSDFMVSLEMHDMAMDVIIGNHDCFYKSTNDINAPALLFGGAYENRVRVHTSAREMTFDGRKVLFIPWINEENEEQTFQRIQNTKASIAFGHLELDGFRIYRNQTFKGGMDPSILKKFELVCTGHFHTRSSQGAIHYLGSPFATTWKDYGTKMGWHILDTETLELRFIENPNHIFKAWVYEDEKDTKFSDFNINDSDFNGKYVMILVKTENNRNTLDKVIERIEETGAIEVSVQNMNEKKESKTAEEGVEDAIIEMEEMFAEAAEEVESADPEKVKEILLELYQEVMKNN